MIIHPRYSFGADFLFTTRFFFMLTINVKLLETVSRGRSYQDKSMLSRLSLEHRYIKSLFFRQEISATGHFACKMCF